MDAGVGDFDEFLFASGDADSESSGGNPRHWVAMERAAVFRYVRELARRLNCLP